MMAFEFKTLSWILCLVTLCTSVVGSGLLCGPSEEVKLHSGGRGSALSLTLANGTNGTAEPCWLNIFAPNVYALSIRIIDAENPFEVFKEELPSNWRLRRKSEKMMGLHKNKTVADCTLQLYYLDAKHGTVGGMAMKVSLCGPEMIRGPLELLPQPIRVQWWPPKAPKRTDNLRLIITAVNAGEDCWAKDQVVCLRAGKDPLLCISDALACDGVRHCPEGGYDETPELCLARRASWAQELARRLASRHGELLGLEDAQFLPSDDTALNITVTPKKEKKISALEAALAPYGPWGYLLLGTLIAAMMMVLFAIWECFCHQMKSSRPAIPPDCEAPAAVTSPNPRVSPRRAPPPAYEELEQPPPPYNLLFPRPKTTPVSTDVQEASTSSAAVS